RRPPSSLADFRRTHNHSRCPPHHTMPSPPSPSQHHRSTNTSPPPPSAFISLTPAAMPPSYLLYHRGLATSSPQYHRIHHPVTSLPPAVSTIIGKAHRKGDALDPWIPAFEQGGQRSRGRLWKISCLLPQLERMSLRYQVTKAKDMETGIPLIFKTQQIVEERKKQRLWFFHKIETEEISDRFVSPCFVYGLEAYDGEINLGVEENMISNEFVVNLCFEHEMKFGNKVVKKELIIALRGEIYFVKFIINPEEDDVEPRVVLGRSILRLTKVIVDFGNETIIIYPKLDPFLVSSEEEEKIGPSMSTRTPLTQEEAEREALAISTYERYSLLEEERPVIETMAYSDKYKKILYEICLDKMLLDGMNKEVEEAIIRIKREALIEKDDPGSFRGSTECKKGILMLNHLKAEPMGLLSNVLCQVGVTIIIAKLLILDMPIDRDALILVGRGFLHTCSGILNTIDNITSTFDGICHQTFHAAKTSLDTAACDSDDEEEYEFKKNKFRATIYRPKPATYLNCNDPLDRSLTL
nr:hypothetical protein [Tanacetum cinerariifolium]